MVIVVIEKRERVSLLETQTFTVLDNCLKEIHADNIIVVMNRCQEEDEEDDIIEFYNDARTEANTSNLPDLTLENILIIKKYGFVTKKMKG